MSEGILINRNFVFYILIGCGLGACNYADQLQPLVYAPPPSPVSGVTVNFCTDPPTPRKYALKMLIILDHSGSNINNYQMNADGTMYIGVPNGAPFIDTNLATDPTGSLRYGSTGTSNTLLNYLKTLYDLPVGDPKKTSKYFSLINFSNDASDRYPIAYEGFTDVDDFYPKVSADAASPADGGYTNYNAALHEASRIIQADITAAHSCASKLPTDPPTVICPEPGTQVSSSYAIVFMSDGAPIINLVDNKTGTATCNPGEIKAVSAPYTSYVTCSQDPNKIQSTVASIIALGASDKFVAGINLFTVYYYKTNPLNIDPNAQVLLSNMAKVGNGQSFNEISGSNIDFTQFEPPVKTVHYSVSNVFVTNASTVWWNDGALHADTDKDGLPDDMEAVWGSNSNLADSDNNGVSDLVKYVLYDGATYCPTPSNCSPSPTRPASPINYAAGACSSVVSNIPGPLFKSSELIGFNDCEKILLGDVLNGGLPDSTPDSNGDQIPDWLEFKNGIPFQIGTNATQSDPFLDGLSYAERIQKSLPLKMSISQLQIYQPAQYEVTQVSHSVDQDCYKYFVTNIPTQRNTDTIRVDVVLKSNDTFEDAYLFRRGEKQYSPDLIFNDWKNAAEISAGTWKKWPQ